MSEDILLSHLESSLKSRCAVESELVNVRSTLARVERQLSDSESSRRLALEALEKCKKESESCREALSSFLSSLHSKIRHEVRIYQSSRSLPWEQESSTSSGCASDYSPSSNQLRDALEKEKHKRMSLDKKVRALNEVVSLQDRFAEIEAMVSERVKESETLQQMTILFEKRIDTAEKEAVKYQKLLQEKGCKLGVMKAKAEKRFAEQEDAFQARLQQMEKELREKDDERKKDIDDLETIFANEKSRLLDRIKELEQAHRKELAQSLEASHEKHLKKELEWKLKYQTLETSTQHKLYSMQSKHKKDIKALRKQAEEKSLVEQEQLRAKLVEDYEIKLAMQQERHMTELSDLNQIHQDALTALREDMERKSIALQTKLELQEKEIVELLKREHQAERLLLKDELKTKVAELKSEWAQDVERQRKQYEALIEEDRNGAEARIKSMEQHLENTLLARQTAEEQRASVREEKLIAEYEEKIARIQEAHKQALAQTKEKAEDQAARKIKQLTSEQDLEFKARQMESQNTLKQSLIDLKAQHQEELNRIMSASEEKIRRLQEAHAAEFSEFRQRMLLQHESKEQEQADRLLLEIQSMNKISNDKLRKAEHQFNTQLAEQERRFVRQNEAALDRARQDMQAALRAQALELDNQHQKDIVKIDKQHQEELKRLRYEHSRELSILKADLAKANKAQASSERKERDSRLTELQEKVASFQSLLEDQSFKHKEELRQAHDKFAHDLEKLQQMHQVEMRQKEDELKSEVQKLHQALESNRPNENLQRELEALKAEKSSVEKELGSYKRGRHQEKYPTDESVEIAIQKHINQAVLDKEREMSDKLREKDQQLQQKLGEAKLAFEKSLMELEAKHDRVILEKERKFQWEIAKERKRGQVELETQQKQFFKEGHVEAAARVQQVQAEYEEKIAAMRETFSSAQASHSEQLEKALAAQKATHEHEMELVRKELEQNLKFREEDFRKRLHQEIAKSERVNSVLTDLREELEEKDHAWNAKLSEVEARWKEQVTKERAKRSKAIAKMKKRQEEFTEKYERTLQDLEREYKHAMKEQEIIFHEKLRKTEALRLEELREIRQAHEEESKMKSDKFEATLRMREEERAQFFQSIHAKDLENNLKVYDAQLKLKEEQLQAALSVQSELHSKELEAIEKKFSLALREQKITFEEEVRLRDQEHQEVVQRLLSERMSALPDFSPGYLSPLQSPVSPEFDKLLGQDGVVRSPPSTRLELHRPHPVVIGSAQHSNKNTHDDEELSKNLQSGESPSSFGDSKVYKAVHKASRIHIYRQKLEKLKVENSEGKQQQEEEEEYKQDMSW